MLRFLLLFFLLIFIATLISFSQDYIKFQPLRLKVRVERIPINYTKPPILDIATIAESVHNSSVSEEAILFYFIDRGGGIVIKTDCDTLFLVPETRGSYTEEYTDVLHKDQPYRVSREAIRRDDFYYMITPLPDSVRDSVYYYRNKHLYSIYIQSINLYTRK